jgi:hypothetical protein
MIPPQEVAHTQRWHLLGGGGFHTYVHQDHFGVNSFIRGNIGHKAWILAYPKAPITRSEWRRYIETRWELSKDLLIKLFDLYVVFLGPGSQM